MKLAKINMNSLLRFNFKNQRWKFRYTNHIRKRKKKFHRQN